MSILASRSRRIAVIGSGPAGVYAVDAVLKSGHPVAVDVFDRLPAPYGLVRYGVAPDHPRIKSVSRVLQGILARPEVRFFGNVTFGADLTLGDLRAHYEAVVFATGAPRDRRLGVPGEELAGSRSAAEFVAWYSGHPDAPADFPLRARQVAVVGAGNVALDVARVLVRDPAELAGTDLPDHVLDGLRRSSVTDVHLVARRGPAQARFTPVELRELGRLNGVDVRVPAGDLRLDPAAELLLATSRAARTNVELLREWAQRPATGAARRIHLRFWRRPVEILGKDDVQGLQVADVAPDGTGERETLPVRNVLRAVGYRAVPPDGLPFDERIGTVANRQGRVVDGTGRPVPGCYVAGWIKRGPSGVIGTNKADAAETVRCLLADLAGSHRDRVAASDPAAVPRLLSRRGTAYVTWPGWLRLDAYEISRGEAQGRARSKVADRATMLSISRDEPLD